jgi:hypothetical protein
VELNSKGYERKREVTHPNDLLRKARDLAYSGADKWFYLKCLDIWDLSGQEVFAWIHERGKKFGFKPHERAAAEAFMRRANAVLRLRDEQRAREVAAWVAETEERGRAIKERWIQAREDRLAEEKFRIEYARWVASEAKV